MFDPDPIHCSGIKIKKYEVERIMTDINKSISSKIIVDKAFYITFDGRRCYCVIAHLVLNHNLITMHVEYQKNDEESYTLKSSDGIHFAGSYIDGEDDSRVEFKKYQRGDSIVLSGVWKCGGREGEWYIRGTASAL